MHAIYISKIVFAFFPIKSLLPLERYPLRKRLHNVNFNYSVFFLLRFCGCCLMLSCCAVAPYLLWLWWTPLHFSIITFWNLSKQSHLIETPTKLQLKASIPGRFSSAALVCTCHPRILPLSHTAQPAREAQGLKFWERRSQEAASSTASLTAQGPNYHAEHSTLEGARLK